MNHFVEIVCGKTVDVFECSHSLSDILRAFEKQNKREWDGNISSHLKLNSWPTKTIEKLINMGWEPNDDFILLDERPKIGLTSGLMIDIFFFLIGLEIMDFSYCKINIGQIDLQRTRS